MSFIRRISSSVHSELIRTSLQIRPSELPDEVVSCAYVFFVILLSFPLQVSVNVLCISAVNSCAVRVQVVPERDHEAVLFRFLSIEAAVYVLMMPFHIRASCIYANIHIVSKCAP